MPTSPRAGVRAVAAGAVVIALVIVLDPVGSAVRAIPSPDLPSPDFGGLPGWLKWVWRGLMMSAIVLAVVGALGKVAGSRGDEAPGNPARADDA